MLAAGIDQVALKAAGLVFVVRRLEADYLSPARFDDQLEVHSRLLEMTGAGFSLSQEIWRDQTLVFRAVVWLVVINAKGRVTRLAAGLRAGLDAFTADVGR